MSTSQYTLQITHIKSENTVSPLELTSTASISTNVNTLDDSPTRNYEQSFTTETEEARLRYLCEEANAEKAALNVEVRALYDKINDLNYKLFQAARNKESLNRANVEISELKEKIAELTQENQQFKLQQNGENLDAMVSEERYKEVEATVVRYRGLLENNISEIQDLNNSLQKAQNKHIALQNENNELRNKLEFALNTLNSSEEGKEDLWESIEENEKIIKNLESQNQTLQQKMLDLYQTNADLKVSLVVNTQEMEKLKVNLNEFEALKDQLRAFAQKNEDLSKYLVQTRQDFQQSEMINANLKNLVFDSYKQVELLQSQVTEKEAFLDASVEKTTNLQMILRQAVKENDIYKNKIQFLEAEHSKLTAHSIQRATRRNTETPSSTKGKDLNKEVKARKIWADELERKILSLLAEKKKLTKEHNELAKKIQERRKEADKLARSTRKSTLSDLRTSSESQVNVSLLLTEWDDEDTYFEEEEDQEEVDCVLTEMNEIPILPEHKGSFVVFKGNEMPEIPEQKGSFVVFRGNEYCEASC